MKPLAQRRKMNAGHSAINIECCTVIFSIRNPDAKIHNVLIHSPAS